MLRPYALDHVALVVADLDKTLDFYRLIGARLSRVKGPDEAGLRSAVVSIGEQELNLFCPAQRQRIDPAQASVVHHFCLNLRADSIEEVIAELRRTGLQIVRGPVRRDSGTSLFLLDPDGVRVELRVPNPLALELMREANFFASLSLYGMCGLVWLYRGDLKSLWQEAKALFRSAKSDSGFTGMDLNQGARMRRAGASQAGWRPGNQIGFG